MKTEGPSALLVALAVTLGVGRAEAADDAAPVFPGHADVAGRTKEFGVELAAATSEAGPSLGAGATVTAFYARWLAGMAGATFSPGFSSPRERWEARGGARIVCPEPVFGKVFVFALAGGGVLFTERDPVESTFSRALTGIAGVGAFLNVTDAVRVRLELREHLRLFGTSDSSHSEVLGLTVAFLSR